MVHVICEPGFEEIISQYLFESGFSGLEENRNGAVPEDQSLAVEGSAEVQPGPVAGEIPGVPTPPEAISYAAYVPCTGPAGSTPPPLERFRTALDDLQARLGSVPARIVSVKTIPAEDWETSWRAGLEAVEVGSSLLIRPSWIAPPAPDRIDIIIDPKMAFGTGGHATTFLCLEMLESIDVAGYTVLDAGCGSGILSIAAAKLGARRVYGIDNDGFSVRNARDNVVINGVEDSVTILDRDIDALRMTPCDLVLANMLSSILIPNVPVFRELLKPRGTIVFSGLLAQEEATFTAVLDREGFRTETVTRRDEWIAVVGTRER